LSVELVEKVYDRYSSFYDLLFGKVLNGGREMARPLLDLFPGAHLLELGVGTGLSLPLLPRNIRITAIDLSPKMLEKARLRTRSLALKNVDLIKMDATSLDFPDRTFDRVLAAYFLSTVPDPDKVVAEMKRVCKPGGYLVFMNHFLTERRWLALLERACSPVCYRILGFRTDVSFGRLVKEHQLEVDSYEPFGFMGNWTAVRCLVP
jgi:phosphatidylethanolamine/phosphatidyl-N-methylethanolamine N-methyltransferase